MGHFVTHYPLTFTLGLILAMVLLAGMRNSLVHAIESVFEWLSVPFAVLKKAMVELGGLTASALVSVIAGLRADDDQDTTWSGWSVIFPLIWLGLGLLIGLADFYLVGLSLAAMLGVHANVPSLGVTPDLFMASLFFAVTATFGLALPELHGVGLARFPWNKLSQEDRAKLKRLCVLCLVLTLIAAGCLWLWRDQQRFDSGSIELEFLLEKLFWLLLVLPVVAGTAIALWAASMCVGAAWALFLMLCRAVEQVIHFVCQTVIWTLCRTMHMVVSVIDVPARFGAGIVNFVTARLRLGIEPIVFDELADGFAKLPAIAGESSGEHSGTTNSALSQSEDPPSSGKSDVAVNVAKTTPVKGEAVATGVAASSRGRGRRRNRETPSARRFSRVS